MILFFKNKKNTLNYVIEMDKSPTNKDIVKLCWLLGEAVQIDSHNLQGCFIGPRKEMLTPWSTNAVEITRNMGIAGIKRMEKFYPTDSPEAEYDRMLQNMYKKIDQDIYQIDIEPEPVLFIEDIDAYNKKEGLALSADEIEYLNEVSRKIGRKLTDSEVFGFSQVNSEHCRHKIFNGTFIIDGKEMPESLFALIKKTTTLNKNRVVSAYKDNVAFMEGPEAEQFAPGNQETSDFFEVKDIKTDISLKAETHNFPTTVEPFYGAATGSGGEIRDRMAGGKASIPMAGTAVYMTSYPRLDGGRPWEKNIAPRKWLYQTPLDILIKASNGASDFGNKFGQPLICGSLLTFEHKEKDVTFGYDKVIMLAGGIGYARAEDSLKDTPETGDKIVLLGGDNYRIGMGGGAVSSVATGEYDSSVELNAVQRANPEMQKRVFNTIRAFAEAAHNPIVSNHDHGAGGHLNCLSELVEDTGGLIDMTKIPVGDPTLSDKEIIGNESQERMGLVLKKHDIEKMRKIAERERSPMYVVGDVTGDMNFCFIDKEGNKPMDIKLEHMFGKPPKTILKDYEKESDYSSPSPGYSAEMITGYLKALLQIEAVACKDWLTNKVDRSVTGKVARQQTAGLIQLPLNDLGAVAIDFKGKKGIATSIGHAPVAGLLDSAAGSILSIAEALTNLVWAPIKEGLTGVSLSANWMWPCKNPGEDARIYKAVKGVSDFAIALGMNIPTGKDSLSMVQKYPGGEKVFSPGTVIISAAGEVTDVKKIVSPVVDTELESGLLYIDFSGGPMSLGGSSFGQVVNKIGGKVPCVENPAYFKTAFTFIQKLVEKGFVTAGHDVSAGGLIVTLLEMNFGNTGGGMNISLTDFKEMNMVNILFSEKPAVVIQVDVNNLDFVKKQLILKKIKFTELGSITPGRNLFISHKDSKLTLNIDEMRDLWFKTSYLLDKNQSGEKQARARFKNYKAQPLRLELGPSPAASVFGIDPRRRKMSGIKGAIVREKGINGDREMAYAMYYAGFDVKDIHITDLIAGRESLEDVNFIVFPGGFSNSDVLGSAKGWAGAFIYNEKAKTALDNFYKREDTLSLGVCNGCQLVVELGLIYPVHTEKPRMLHNNSNKFESTFLSVDIRDNNSVMLGSMAGMKLGIWVAHGEGKFDFPYEEDKYNIPLKYSYSGYPGNPNGSMFDAAGICSADGRHLAMMPHLERAIFPWQWGYYPNHRKNDEVSPWIEAFVNAREWIKTRKGI